ncbi:MAG: 30S ribosomal protein S6 [bacterium]|nr:30S ribosomal protein S6 [bacterium]
MNRKYEIGFIINPEATEEDVKKITDSVTSVITKDEGTVDKVDDWGRRKLAYPIQKHNEGIYTFIDTQMKGSSFFEIERRLKLNEKVMRFVVLRLDDKLKKANKLTKKWKRMEKMKKSHDDSNDSRGGDRYVKREPRKDTRREVKREVREANDEK